MAVRWMTPLVEPPMASSTRSAFSKALAVRMRSGVSFDFAIATATWRRSARRCGCDRRSPRAARRRPARVMPSASATQAMVLAVPITEQVPTLATSWLFTRAISSASISSAR